MFPVCVITIWIRSNFQQIIQSGFAKANHPIEFNMIWKAMLIPSMGYIVGFLSVYMYIVNHVNMKHVKFQIVTMLQS